MAPSITSLCTHHGVHINVDFRACDTPGLDGMAYCTQTTPIQHVPHLHSVGYCNTIISVYVKLSKQKRYNKYDINYILKMEVFVLGVKSWLEHQPPAQGLGQSSFSSVDSSFLLMRMLQGSSCQLQELGPQSPGKGHRLSCWLGAPSELSTWGVHRQMAVLPACLPSVLGLSTT